MGCMSLRSHWCFYIMRESYSIFGREDWAEGVTFFYYLDDTNTFVSYSGDPVTNAKKFYSKGLAMKEIERLHKAWPNMTKFELKPNEYKHVFKNHDLIMR